MDIGSRVRFATSTISLATEVTPSSVREDAPFEAFVDSMPAAYRNLFDEGSMRAHAAIVERRAAAARTVARVEAWKRLPEGVVAICVVADDVVGLSSRVCAAVFTHGVEVVGAQVYRRMRGPLAAEAIGRRADSTPALSPCESIGLFWIRRAAGASGARERARTVTGRDLALIARTLQPLLRGTDGLLLATRLSRGVNAARVARQSMAQTGQTGQTGRTAQT
jgi:hypothetical protein